MNDDRRLSSFASFAPLVAVLLGWVVARTVFRRGDLPSGGYLNIDYAEALTVFDVNSGSFVGRGKRRLCRARPRHQ